MSAFTKHLRAVCVLRASPASARFVCPALALLFLAASALANPNVTFSTADFLGRNYTNRSLIIAPVSGPFIDGTNVISTASYTTNTGSGSIVISNMVSGTYRVTIAGNPTTTFLMTVPTGDSDLSAAALVVNNPPAVNNVASGILSSYYVRHTNGNLVSPTNFFRSNITAAGSIGLSYTANGGLVISNAASGGGGTNQYGFLVATNYVDIQSAPSSNSHAIRLQDLNTISNQLPAFVSDISGTLNLYDDFSGTNGPVTTNQFISEPIPVGRRLHIRGPGGADTGTNVARLNNRLVFTGTDINNNESVYIAHQIAGIEGQYAGASNQIRYAVIRFDLDDGATLGQTPLLMISSSGVVEEGRLIHFGYNPTTGTADVTFHTNGFNGVSNYLSFSWTGVPGFGPSSNLVFAWSIDGTNLWANFGGDIRYTNSPLLDDFQWGDKTIVQSFEFTTNATRRLLFRSVAASTQPVRMTELPRNFVASTNSSAVGLTLSGNTTNAHGARFIGSGSNSIESITLLTATNVTITGNGVLALDGDRITGTYTNAGTNVGGVYTNPILAGIITNSAGAIIQGSGSNAILAVTSLGVTNAAVGGALTAGSATFTNRTTFLDGTTNSGPVTFPTTSRAWVTFGPTNTGLGINSGEVALFNSGNVSVSATVNGSQRVLTINGNVDNSQNQIRMSDFGPRIIEDQRQGRLVITNGFGATSVTNLTYGNVEARNATGGGGGGLISYRTNAPAATEFTNTAWMIWMSNTVGGAVQPYIAVNVGGSVTNWLINVTK